jgi:hypothetical protein
MRKQHPGMGRSLVPVATLQVAPKGAVDVPTGDIPPVPDPDDLATVRDFNFALKIACDELHDDPFNPVARAELVRLNTDEAPTADARSFAWRRRCGRSQCVSVSAAFDVAFRSAKHR